MKPYQMWLLLSTVASDDHVKRTVNLKKLGFIWILGFFGNIWDNASKQLKNTHYKSIVIFSYLNAELLHMIYLLQL